MAERANAPTPSRVPPNNLRAEESVLGAMLLSREAIAEVVETLDPDHFYKPAHGHLYDAIMGLYGAGQPVDAVTVAEELQRAGLLEDIGGPSLLLDLQATTPAISNAAHYAKIVEEHALLRRLIVVSNEIAETAYGVPDDVVKAIDEAESLMFEVAQRRVTNTTAEIKDLLSANLDRLEQLYERGEAITGSSTGYIDLDEMLAGLQPNALYVVGARPAMGKALALDTPLATPEGWTTMGEVRVGDVVFDEGGQPTAVTYKSPVFTDHDCYEVVFDDGSTIVADADHLWFTWDNRAWRSKRSRDDRTRRPPAANPRLARDQSARWIEPAVRSTRDIAETLLTAGDADQRPNHRIPVADPLDCPEMDLPIDPYVLGCWLGDGHTGKPRITTMDVGIVDAFRADGWSMEPLRSAGRATTFAVRSALDDERDFEQVGDRPMLAFTRALRDCGLWESCRTVAKHIPAAYLRAGSKQRLALLQGIMDTDGCVVKGQSTCQISMSSRQLIGDVRELVLSLGYKVGPCRHKTSNFDTDVWTINFSAPDPVFRLARKSQAQQIADRPNSASRWRKIVDVRPVSSVPTQCITVDSPNHLYLAGREMIPTHNTAFGLGMAANTAMKDQKPVLVFSLEMSQLELSQRILCSEALVDSSRVRTGKIGEAEWTRISHAVGRLAEAPIYIDDNPHTSVMEIRAKARRLKSRVGDLGVVIVDYIQLMTGRSNAESRQVEVSEISRGLKILARELEAPVVALAQLNRALEQRVDKRPMLSDLRESGCMPASTRLMLSDGTETTMGELLLSQATPDVLAIDERGRTVSRRLVKTFPSGIKPVYRLTLASGRTVDATACHRFLTVNGWEQLGNLDVNDFVATPRVVPEPPEPDVWPDAEVILLAHLLGDGSVVKSVKYASADPANVEAVFAAVRHFGCEARFEGAAGAGSTGAVQVWIPAGRQLTHGVHHPIRDWLEPLGVWGKRSYEKTIPESVFRLSTKQVALFLHHLWSTDGSITLSRNGRGPMVRCYYATTSHDFALALQRLLLRFEIRSTVSIARKSGYRPCYHVRIQGQPDLLRFLTELGCHGRRGDVVPEAIEIVSNTKPNPNNDLVPWPIARSVKQAAAAAGVSHREIAVGLGERYSGSYLLGSESRPRRFSRERLRRIGEIVDSSEIVDVATSDIYWDQIRSIELLGSQPTFDATVEDVHNFIANGIVAHNSLEQDADVVMFLYRDEVYDDQSPDKGVAEVIVAKHRNGPVGKVRLAFRGQYTRFDNMARSIPGTGPPPDSSGDPGPDF